MDQLPIQFFYINMDHNGDRRRRMEQQAEQYGIKLHRIAGVNGAALSDAELTAYDRRRRQSMYAAPMSKGEHGCILSHLKAMQVLWDSGAEYGVILEDDAVWDEHFLPRLRYLIEHTAGWQCIKLYTEPCKHYRVTNNPADAPVQLTFPKKMPWGAIGWLYRRSALPGIQEGFKRYWMGFDVQLVHILFSRSITACGVTPNLVSTSDPCNENSSIDAVESRTISYQTRPTRLQYLRRRFSVWGMACGKLMMRRRLKQSLSFH